MFVLSLKANVSANWSKITTLRMRKSLREFLLEYKPNVVFLRVQSLLYFVEALLNRKQKLLNL